MAVAFRAESHSIAGSGANANPGEPAGAANGDVLVGMLVVSGTTAPSMPSGWATLYTVSGGSSFRAVVGWIARGSSAPSTTFTNVSAYREAFILAISGGDTSALDSQSSSGSTYTSAANPDPPATTAVSNAALAVCGGIHWAGSLPSWTAPSGYTIRTDNTSGNDGTMATKVLSSSGTEDPAAFAGANGFNDAWNGFTITIAPAGSASGATHDPTKLRPPGWLSPASRPIPLLGDTTVAAASSFTGSGDVNSVVTIAATGFVSGDSAVTETTTIAATGTGVGTGAVSETATIAATGTTLGTGAVAEVVTIAATGNMTATGTGSVAETVTIAATGGGTGTSSVASVVTIVATGGLSATGTGALSETVTIAATGSGTGTGAVSETVTIAATGNMTATGTGDVTSTVTISATGSTGGSFTGTGAISETTTIAATGYLTALGTGAVAETVTISATGFLSVTGSGGTVAEVVTITATGAGTGTAARSVTATIAATGSSNGTAARAVTVTIAATGYLTTTGTASRPVTVTISATGVLSGLSFYLVPSPTAALWDADIGVPIWQTSPTPDIWEVNS